MKPEAQSDKLIIIISIIINYYLDLWYRIILTIKHVLNVFIFIIASQK